MRPTRRPATQAAALQVRIADFGVQVSGFVVRVSGRVVGFGFQVSGFRFMVSGERSRVKGVTPELVPSSACAPRAAQLPRQQHSLAACPSASEAPFVCGPVRYVHLFNRFGTSIFSTDSRNVHPFNSYPGSSIPAPRALPLPRPRSSVALLGTSIYSTDLVRPSIQPIRGTSIYSTDSRYVHLFNSSPGSSVPAPRALRLPNPRPSVALIGVEVRPSVQPIRGTSIYSTATQAAALPRRVPFHFRPPVRLRPC